jgi:hypothetical protein
MGFVKLYGGSDVHVAYAVSVCHAKRLIISNVFCDLTKAPACHCLITSVHNRDVPRFSALVVNFHSITAHVEGDI